DQQHIESAPRRKGELQLSLHPTGHPVCFFDNADNSEDRRLTTESSLAYSNKKCYLCIIKKKSLWNTLLHYSLRKTTA
ncbi:MAG: hypothetical protein K2H72_02275, partial [Muribaculaceae bacterium]|nr:hypothetical protein [Muribaculaceae bacterium]